MVLGHGERPAAGMRGRSEQGCPGPGVVWAPGPGRGLELPVAVSQAARVQGEALTPARAPEGRRDAPSSASALSAGLQLGVTPHV